MVRENLSNQQRDLSRGAHSHDALSPALYLNSVVTRADVFLDWQVNPVSGRVNVQRSIQGIKMDQHHPSECFSVIRLYVIIFCSQSMEQFPIRINEKCCKLVTLKKC